jgi:hypothetical protein
VRIHAVTTQPQFLRHVRPIFEELPAELQGEVLTGAEGHHPRVGRFPPDDVFIVGGFGSIAACGDRAVVYVEHGAGQSYLGARSRHRESYPGGEHPPNVIAYVCPNERVARAWHGRPAIAVGCPALDGIESRALGADAVVFTFHWDAPLVCPEARSARPHYLAHLHEMVSWVRDTTKGRAYPLGHWHPRDRWAEGIWRNLRVPTEPDPDRALEQAALVIACNTSFAYEAAALGIPTVALNAPWYRRDVHHGLRFWDHPPGLMVDDADELMALPVDDWINDPLNRTVGHAAARRAYSMPVGSGGAALAAQFIVEVAT